MTTHRTLPAMGYVQRGRVAVRRSLWAVAMLLAALALVAPALADENPPSSQEALTAPEAGWVLQSANSPMDDCAAGDGICLYENPGYTGTWVRLTGPGAFVDFAYFGVAINNKAATPRRSTAYSPQFCAVRAGVGGELANSGGNGSLAGRFT